MLENSSKPTVVVGMSGGVDSSVAAYLLKQQGYHVIGLFMKCWDDENEYGECPSAVELEDVAEVCDKIGIPYYSVNFVKEYWEGVFEHFLSESKAGRTPNPDILCNREIKFKHFYQKALDLGADYLATGHYCQNIEIDDVHYLAKGADPNKDQSYFLHAIKSDVLKNVLFPIGHLPKPQVREIAREAELITSDKKDSTGICFIGKKKFRDFLHNFIPFKKGNFETSDGTVVGQHNGYAFYTIGQRKGLGIGGEGDAWYVVGKDIERNVVIIERGAEHPALFSDDLIANDVTWISGSPTTTFPYACQAKIRYRQESQDCVIESIEDGKVSVTFTNPQRAATPGQSIVFYDKNICLGGGVISQVGASHYAKQQLITL